MPYSHLNSRIEDGSGNVVADLGPLRPETELPP